MTRKKSAKEPPKFEEGMARLEEIVGQLESDDLALEESLSLFEEGVTLSKTLDARLVAAEMKVEELLRSGDDDDDEGEGPETALLEIDIEGDEPR
jgi:exodeoxyribonuclease VII small subunit